MKKNVCLYLCAIVRILFISCPTNILYKYSVYVTVYEQSITRETVIRKNKDFLLRSWL